MPQLTHLHLHVIIVFGDYFEKVIKLAAFELYLFRYSMPLELPSNNFRLCYNHVTVHYHRIHRANIAKSSIVYSVDHEVIFLQPLYGLKTGSLPKCV